MNECVTSDEALKIEHELVKQYKSDPFCLNRNNGGRNFEHINNVSGLNNSVNNCSLGGQQCSKKLKEDPEFAKKFSQKISEGLTPEIIARVAEHNKGNKYSLGYRHTASAKEKIGAVTSVTQKGEGNSQYGTYWITDGNTNKKWHDSKGVIPEGFYRGRVMK